MEELVTKEIRNLNLRMEFVNYIGGVSLAVFFLVLSQKMYYEKFYQALLGFLEAVTITLVIFPI